MSTNRFIHWVKNGDIKNLLNQKDADFYRTNRGGDITYHGPGQITGYPILDLEAMGISLSRYIFLLEESVINSLRHYGLHGKRLKTAAGVWLFENNNRNERKICAIGIKSSRFITMHGFAFNVNTDLNYFKNIIPCGIADKQVTSLQQELQKEIDFQEVKQVLKTSFANCFDCLLV